MASHARVPHTAVQVALPAGNAAWTPLPPAYCPSPAAWTVYLAQWPRAVGRALLWTERLGLAIPHEFSVHEDGGPDTQGVACPILRSFCRALDAATALDDPPPGPEYLPELRAEVAGEVRHLLGILRRHDALLPPSPATNGVSRTLWALSSLLRLQAAPRLTSLALVIWQPAFGMLSLLVGRTFWEVGGPPWRVLFLRLDDAASAPFLPLRSSRPVDVQQALSLAVHLRVPFGVRCSYVLPAPGESQARWSDPHLGDILPFGMPHRVAPAPCLSWAGEFCEDDGPVAPIMFLSSPADFSRPPFTRPDVVGGLLDEDVSLFLA